MKIGTIGSGFIVRYMLENVAKTEGITCEAVYSRTMENGKKLADEFGVEKVYTDLDEMCKDEAIDAIYVASPNSLHYEHAKKALSYGKHVICEKPFTPTAAEAEERFACRRLASRISDLRELGDPIHKVTVTGRNRFGEPVHYASYSLINKEDINAQ